MINFKIKYKINEGLVMSPSELKSLYLYGIPIQEKTGTTMSDETIKTYIKSAQKQIENLLDLKLQKQIISENFSFYINDFRNFGYVPTSYPVVKPYKLTGFFNTTRQIEYPQDWLSYRQTSDGERYFREISILPITATPQTSPILYGGFSPWAGLHGSSKIPNYWKAQYCTGFDEVPADILTVIGKYASMFIFHQLGDIILSPGIAAMSLGVDGLSQSVSTTSSATNAGYGARITGYHKDLAIEVPRLLDNYKGIGFTTC